MKYFFLLLVLLELGIGSYVLSTQSSAAEAEQKTSWTFHRLNTEENRKHLQFSFSTRSTVGVIPVRWVDGELCVLLARERIDGNPKKAGQYCDFGGSADVNETIIGAAGREYREESMGELTLDPECLKEGFLIKGENPVKKRHICYIVYPLSSEEYDRSLKLNTMRLSYKEGDLHPSYLEKDRFHWFKVGDLFETIKDSTFDLKPVNPPLEKGEGRAMLRGFFIEDFLKNSLLPQVIEQVTRPKTD